MAEAETPDLVWADFCCEICAALAERRPFCVLRACLDARADVCRGKALRISPVAIMVNKLKLSPAMRMIESEHHKRLEEKFIS